MRWTSSLLGAIKNSTLPSFVGIVPNKPCLLFSNLDVFFFGIKSRKLNDHFLAVFGNGMFNGLRVFLEHF